MNRIRQLTGGLELAIVTLPGQLTCKNCVSLVVQDARSTSSRQVNDESKAKEVCGRPVLSEAVTARLTAKKNVSTEIDSLSHVEEST